MNWIVICNLLALLCWGCAKKPIPAPDPVDDSLVEEVGAYSDPFTPAPSEPEPPPAITYEWPVTVYFEFDQDRSTDFIPLTSAAMNTCQEIQIDGHACQIGPEEYNQDLSLRRAEYMKAYVIANGFDGPITVNAFGESSPVSQDNDEINRRVEVYCKENFE